MKTTINSIVASALFALSFLSVNAATLEDPKETAKATYAVNVFKGKEGKVNFLLEKSQGKKLSVTLRNGKGDILFNENITKNAKGYARRFDVASLSDGTYTIEVTDGETKLVKDFVLSTDQPARLVTIN